MTNDLTKRMEAVVRGLAAEIGTSLGHWSTFVPTSLVAEARAIVAELPEPIDPDRVAAIDLLDSYGDALPDALSLALAALKRGRTLAAEERG